ncbi:MAG: CBS domain-containing protein [Pseudomonadota bacterium]
MKGRGIVSVAPDATIQQAAGLLGEKRIGCVLVIGDGDAIVGILSERDIVRALGADGDKCLDRPVAKIMTQDVVTCRESDTTENVMEQMTRGRFRHLPVIENGRCVGLISIGDVVKERMAEVQREAADMRAYITAY